MHVPAASPVETLGESWFESAGHQQVRHGLFAAGAWRRVCPGLRDFVGSYENIFKIF